jgi:hypothetical protein
MQCITGIQIGTCRNTNIHLQLLAEDEEENQCTSGQGTTAKVHAYKGWQGGKNWTMHKQHAPKKTWRERKRERERDKDTQGCKICVAAYP